MNRTYRSYKSYKVLCGQTSPNSLYYLHVTYTKDTVITTSPESIGIIGYGRLGQLMSDIVKNDFRLLYFDRDPTRLPDGVDNDLRAAAGADVIFICVPILYFEEAVAAVQPHISPETVILDMCSVKMYPTQIMQRYFSSAQILPAHPMFGPCAVEENNGFEGLPFVLCPTADTHRDITAYWHAYLQDKGLQVHRMTCEEHDKCTAYSLCLTHYIAHLIKPVIVSTDIDAKTTCKLHEIVQVCCANAPELFEGLMAYNPFVRDMRRALKESFEKIEQQLK